MTPIEMIIERAKKNPATIVYPEGEDVRVITACNESIKAGVLLKAILLGDEKIIKEKVKENGLNLNGCEIINPKTSDKIDKFSSLFYELRKHKGISIEEAKNCVLKNLNFAGLLTRTGEADGFIGGSVNTTGDTVRAALYTLGLAKGMTTLSSFFIMDVPDSEFGDEGLFLYADCAVIPKPSSRQLVNITLTASAAYKSLFNKEARCALLSYSTKGSAEGESVNRIRKALDILKDNHPDVIVDGEMQVDAAIVPSVAKIKMKDSPVGGKANVLIFPDLNSGNISYKLTQRLAKAEAIGPILTGMAYPANDLSRGCSAEDIFAVTAITVLQSSKVETH